MVLDDSYSDYSVLESGLPYGSILGPLLFHIYINDLERNIKSNIKCFADDTMLCSLVKDPEIILVTTLWADQWKLEINPDHTKQATEVLFSWKTFNVTFCGKNQRAEVSWTYT